MEDHSHHETGHRETGQRPFFRSPEGIGDLIESIFDGSATREQPRRRPQRRRSLEGLGHLLAFQDGESGWPTVTWEEGSSIRRRALLALASFYVGKVKSSGDAMLLLAGPWSILNAARARLHEFA